MLALLARTSQSGISSLAPIAPLVSVQLRQHRAGGRSATILRRFFAALCLRWSVRPPKASSTLIAGSTSTLGCYGRIARHTATNLVPLLTAQTSASDRSRKNLLASSSSSSLKTIMKRSATAVSTSAGAGSNWKALKKSLNSDASISSSSSPARRKASFSSSTKPKGIARTRRSDLNAVSNGHTDRSRTSSPAPKTLPWFAGDISPQDLELVRLTASDRITRSGQWEGLIDCNLKKQIILGGLPEDAAPAKKEPGNYLAIDCEMVGVGEKGCQSLLARVSIVNFHGVTILDRFVRPQEKVTDYRTWVSGVRPRDLKNAPSFSEVQGEVANLIKGKVLVGHAIQNDLKALLVSHPRALIRDTASFPPLRDLAKTKYPSLKKLAKLVLGIDIQMQGESHSSVEDARATMAIFRSQKSKWDETLRSKGHSTFAIGAIDAIDGSSAGKSTSRSMGNKVCKPPANGMAVDPASPTLGKRSMSSSPAAAAAGGGGGERVFQDTLKLKARMAAKADWWKDPI